MTTTAGPPLRDRRRSDLNAAVHSEGSDDGRRGARSDRHDDRNDDRNDEQYENRRDSELAAVAARYAEAITPTMTALIDPDDPNDPIARQFTPDRRELDRRPDELDDPIGDAQHAPVPGIVHRYPDRVLLMPLTVCPVYCRFCFRRETVGGPASNLLDDAALDDALGYIAGRDSIWEVILSGGDPLILSERRIRSLLERLRSIPHVRIVRVHTRVPLVAPERVTDALLDSLAAAAPVYLALHANHAREFSAAGRAALGRLADRGIAMISQTVLLRGVNDSVDALGDLMRTFVENRVKPYYLHQLDKAPGTAHFCVPIEEGRALVAALRGTLSGLCQPTYVLDIPGGWGKSPLGPAFVETDADGTSIRDFRGRRHPLNDC